MTFQSLYRKHRPQRFADVLGQEHVTGALLNAVKEDRVGHAYLFSGPRGTGKTTTARLLAMALNCTDPGPDAEPCGVCDSCTEIARARESATVIERDAASAGGVDEMRELLRGVDLSVPGKRKVYILDEVHMLTKGASNALLKTLEEPLPHVIFVLATTEPEKVLPTIRSRTQHFQFQLLSVDRLVDLLGDIAKREGVDADEETLRSIARHAAGSGRDSLSLLDQALALGQGSLDPDTVGRLFEATPFDRRAALVSALDEEDAAGALEALGALLEQGADVRQVADDLLRHLRDVFLVAASKGRAHLDHLSDDERSALEAQGSSLGYQRAVRAIETLGEAVVDMRRAPDPRLILEVALVRLARRDAGTRVEVLLDRVERLERSLDELRQGGAIAAAPPPPAAPPAERVRRVKPEPTPEPAPSASPAAAPETVAEPENEAPADAAPEEPPASPASRPALGAVRKARGGDAPAPPAPEAPASEANAPAAETTEAPEAPAAPPPPAPAPAPAPSSSEAGDLDLDDVVLAWPKALEGMRAMLKAVAREAQPIAVEAGTVVLGLPQRLEAQRRRLDDALTQVGELLGAALDRSPIRLRVDLHEGFLDVEVEEPAEAREDAAEIQDLRQALAADDEDEAPPVAEPRVDSVDRLVDAFAATVEEESETP